MRLMCAALLLLAACSAPPVGPAEEARDADPIAAVTSPMAAEAPDVERELVSQDRDPRAALTLADRLYDEREFEQAAAAYGDALERGARDERVHIRRGHALYALGRLDAAKDAYLAGLADHPESDSTLRNGLYFLAGRDWVKATSLLQEATRTVPHSPAAWSYYGYSLALSEDWENARDALLHAETLRPLASNDLVHLGRALKECGDKSSARIRFRDALTLDQHSEAAARELGLLIAESVTEGVQAKDLLAACDEVTRLAPSNPEVHNNCGYTLRNVAEAIGGANTDVSDTARVLLERAVLAYETVASLRPDDPQFISDTGLMYDFYPVTRNDKKALWFFTRSLDLSGHVYRDAFNGLQRVCTRTGDWETLRRYAELVVTALESGRAGVAPGGRDGAPQDMPPAGTEILLEAARAALTMSNDIIAGKRGPASAPASRGGAPWPAASFDLTPLKLSSDWVVERPESAPSGESVSLLHACDPETAYVFGSRATYDMTQGGRVVRGGVDQHGRVLVRDAVGADGAFEVDMPFTVTRNETGGNDMLQAHGKLLDSPQTTARITPHGSVVEGSVRVAGAFGAMEVMARSMPPSVIAELPENAVQPGETWDIDAAAFFVRSALVTLNDAEVSATGYATLVGFEDVDGVRCARIETWAAGSATGERLEFQPGLYGSGTVRFRVRTVVFHGPGGYTRKSQVTEEQHLTASITLMPGRGIDLRRTSTRVQHGRPESPASGTPATD